MIIHKIIHNVLKRKMARRNLLPLAVMCICVWGSAACSRSEAGVAVDRLEVRESVPFSADGFRSARWLGLTDGCPVFLDSAGKMLFAAAENSDRTEIARLDADEFPAGVTAVQTDRSLVVSDNGDRLWVLYRDGGFVWRELPPLAETEMDNTDNGTAVEAKDGGASGEGSMPARVIRRVRLAGAAEKDGVLWLAVENGTGRFSRPERTVNIYTLKKGEEGPYRKVMTLPCGADAPEAAGCTLAFQSNGADACAYVFMPETIWEYNLRLGKVREAARPERMPEGPFSGGVARGAAHVVLAGPDGLALYHTITGTCVSFPVPGAAAGEQVLGYGISGGEICRVSAGAAGRGTVEVLAFERITGGFTPGDIVVVILYFLALLGIGIYFSKRQKNPDDYFKGGHRIPWWAAGLSLFGTALSAITFMAIPAKAFATNWSYMLFNAGIVLVAPIIMFVFIPFFRSLNITTAYQYLEVRFNSLIRVICSLAFIIFQVGRMGVVLFLPSIAVHLVTGVNIFLCISLMGVFSILYTRMGGIEAVVWTDALQVVILLGGAIFAIAHIVLHSGIGVSQTVAIAWQDGKLSLGDTAFDLTSPAVWTTLIATFFTNLTTYGTDQSMVQRYLTTGSQKEAQKSVLTNALLTIPATVIFFTIGTVLYVYFKTHPQLMSVTMENTDAVFPWYICSQLPVGLTGLLISGIFAAAMSTLSGSMNSAATAYIIDIRPKLFPRKGEASLGEAKRATLIVGGISLLFAFLMATWDINSLWDEFNRILGLILGSMGGLFMLGMITRRANSAGALIGMAVSIAVQVAVAAYTPVHLLLYTSVGFVTCFAVGYAASLVFGKSGETKKHIK